MKKIKLIIVENDLDEQEFMEEGFKDSGLFDLIAMLRNGDELFSYLSAHPNQLPDIILSDLNMPGKNGYDIIQGIRENKAYAHIPVVITSTSNSREFINKSLGLGAALFLLKPDTFNEYKEYAANFHKKLTEKGILV